MSARGRTIHVLLVDDSALARELVGTVLKRAGMVVSFAADGLIALEAMREKRPDVVVLDLMLPRLDGLAFLRRTRGRGEVPVVICSNAVSDGSDAGLLALENGAAALIAKPRVTARGTIARDASAELVCAVLEAAGARAGSGETRTKHGHARSERPRRSAHGHGHAPPHDNVSWRTSQTRIVARRPSPVVIAMGASTGGTEALRVVLSEMPKDAPPILVVQHMPERFTAAFAKRLDGLCRINVREATHGEAVVSGSALISPGNRHLRLVRTSRGFHVETTEAPPVNGHRPSVDVLFRSVAEAAGRSAVGVLMTGMGSDGAAGLLAMKRAGACTIAQDRATCIVFGMPNAAIALGAADDVVPLSLIHLAALGRAPHARRATATAT
jgi:two-component system chemotaxis response regulator CheB